MEVVAVFFATAFLTAVFFGVAFCVFAASALFSAPPTLLRGGDDRLPASLRQLPFWFGRYFWGGGLRRRFGLCPSLSLGLGNPSTASSTHLPPLVFCRFRLDRGFRGVTGQYRPELGNVGVDVAFLFLETENGGANDFGSEFCSECL
jgi:hypothetical protein